MKHQCEALMFCHGGGGDKEARPGDQCTNRLTEQVRGSGRWLCWVHRVSFLKPAPREHAPMQFIPQRQL